MLPVSWSQDYSTRLIPGSCLLVPDKCKVRSSHYLYSLHPDHLPPQHRTQILLGSVLRSPQIAWLLFPLWQKFFRGPVERRKSIDPHGNKLSTSLMMKISGMQSLYGSSDVVLRARSFTVRMSLSISVTCSRVAVVLTITSVTLSTIFVDSISIKHVSTMKPPLLYTLITA